MGSGRSWCLSQVCLNSKSISFLCATVLTFKPTGSYTIVSQGWKSQATETGSRGAWEKDEKK